MYIVAPMFKFLLSFSQNIPVTQFLAIDEFISWTLAALLMTGLLFLLPIFMYSLAALRIITARFWINQWREAFIVFLIISSVATPDVSGLSVIILSIPMIFLYGLGIALSSLHK